MAVVGNILLIAIIFGINLEDAGGKGNCNGKGGLMEFYIYPSWRTLWSGCKNRMLGQYPSI